MGSQKLNNWAKPARAKWGSKRRGVGGKPPSRRVKSRDANMVREVLDLRNHDPDRLVKDIEPDVAKRYGVSWSYLRRKLAEHRKKLRTNENIRTPGEGEIEGRYLNSPLFDEGEDELPAVLTIHGQTLTILDWAREANIHPRVLEARIRAGWDPEWALVPFPGMAFWEGWKLGTDPSHPHKPTSWNEFHATVKPGHYFINPADGKLYQAQVRAAV